MKRIFKFFTGILCVLCMGFSILLTSCSSKSLTLTLYDNDGTTVLNTVEVEKGHAPERPEDPVKDDFIFDGWYVTPTSSRAFDFDAIMNEDSSAYARWKVADFQDDRDWVLAGTPNNWGANLDDYHMTKKSGTGNVFELSLDLFIDDEFQLTVLLEDGTLAYSTEGARAAFSHVVAGKEYVEGAGGLGTYKNIVVKEDGNYTLSLVSDPETDNNALTIVRNGDPSTPVVEHEIVSYAIKGSKVTGWADLTDEKYLMKKNAEGNFALKIELYANDEFMFVAYEMVEDVLTAMTKYIKSDVLDVESCEQVQAKVGGNFTTSANGTYTFVYNPTTEKIKVDYSIDFSLEILARPTTWYILGNGSVPGSVLNTAAWGLADEEKQKLADKGDGVYEITLDLYEKDAFKICSDSSWANARDFSYMVNPGDNFKANGNIEVMVSGNYTLKLTIDEDETKDKIEWVRNGDATGGQESQVVIEAYAIKGSKVTGWANLTDEQYLMRKGSDGNYTLTIELYANDEFMFVAYELKDGALSALASYIKSDMLEAESCEQIQAKAGGNFTTSANGTYTFTYKPATEKIAVSYSEEFSLEVQQRPTTWYILGNSTTEGSVLKTSSWGLNDEIAQKLVDKGNGVYEITLNLYVNDEFQICSDGSWSNKHGISTLQNPGTNFEGTNNIKVLVEGNYTLTITIEENEVEDKITWVRNGDCA